MTESNDMDLENPGQYRELWFESAGTRLFAVEKGFGRPIVFLHGGLADHRASLFRIGSLASRYTIITPDVRGSGRSHCSDELSWDQLADDVCALLDQLEIDRAFVGGVSFGSAVALRFARRHPQRTLGLILLAPVYAGSELGLSEAQQAAFANIDDVGKRVEERGIDALLPLYQALPEAIRERATEMARSFDPASVAASARFLGAVVQPFDSLSELAAIEAPALLAAGTDPEHPAEVCALYAKHLRRRVVVHPEDPDLLERVARFCLEHSVSQA